MFNTDSSDAFFLSTNAEIPVGSSSVCVLVEAYDDSIAEVNESVILLARPDNLFNEINQITILRIIDNDGL